VGGLTAVGADVPTISATNVDRKLSAVFKIADAGRGAVTTACGIAVRIGARVTLHCNADYAPYRGAMRINGLQVEAAAGATISCRHSSGRHFFAAK
jgi:hypothetical protein